MLLGSRRSEIIGHVDHAGGGLIRGWAADLGAVRTRLALDVFLDGIYLGCARAGAFREDLRAKGIGDGYYGFVFHHPALAAKDAAGRLDVVAPDPRRTRLTVSAEASASAGAAPAGEHADVRSFVRSLLEAIARDADPSRRCVVASPATGARIDRLFAATPEPSVSAFAAHIAAKYDICVAGDFPWDWYLETYGVEQAVRVPLSVTDIDALAGAHLADRAFGGERRRWRVSRKERLSQWCVHGSRRLEVEDCLVDPQAIEALRAVPWFARRAAFPLSYFMRLERRRHPLLRGCSIRTARDRIAFYVLLMLLALRDAHYLALMPARWLDRVLSEGAGGSLFETVQQTLLGCREPVLSPERYRARIDSMGFDLSTKRFSTVSERGHRLAPGARPLGTRAVEVQMIGPFHQSLGLSESCRRVARALQATGLDVNFVDYRIGGRPRTAAADIGTDGFGDARINILHLNAEEVPEAMVSLPGLLGGAHTIVIPYWELDRPARAHRLGLDLVDEVWCTTRFLAEVFAGARPVCHIGMSIDDRRAPPTPGPVAAAMHEGAFTVLCVADALSWLQRKNVLGAVVAFQTAFAGDAAARLIVKVRNVDAAPPTSHGNAWREMVARCGDDPRIEMFDTDLAPDAHIALLAGADCLLSLHRAEGLGLDILDAMHLGTPVVATAYSGNMDFCNEATAWLVDYDLVPVAPGQYAYVEAGHVWAEPRLDSAVAALRAVRVDVAARTQKARAASDHVQADGSTRRLAARLSSLLRARLARRQAAE